MAQITDNNPRFLFSANADKVTISAFNPLSHSLFIRLYRDDGYEDIQIPVSTANPQLDLRSIIEESTVQIPSISPEALVPYLPLRPNPNFALCLMSGGVEPESVEHTVIIGGISEKTALEALNLISGRYWLTQRPQINHVCKWGREQILVWLIPDSRIVDEAVDVTVYAKVYTPAGVSTVSLYTDSNAHYGDIIAIPVSFAAINTPTAVAWDITVETSSQSEGTQENRPISFILDQSKANYRGFIYRNALGGFDSVYSRGEFRYVPQYEPAAFRNEHMEKNLDPTAVEYMEVDTGVFGTAAERMMWLDFLRTREKYLVEQDGKVSPIILDESSPELILKELGHFTFRFHKAEDPVGNGMPMPDYQEELPVPDGDWSRGLWLDGNIWDPDRVWNDLPELTPDEIQDIQESWDGHRYSEVERVIKEEFAAKYSKPAGGIPASDLQPQSYIVTFSMSPTADQAREAFEACERLYSPNNAERSMHVGLFVHDTGTNNVEPAYILHSNEDSFQLISLRGSSSASQLHSFKTWRITRTGSTYTATRNTKTIMLDTTADLSDSNTSIPTSPAVKAYVDRETAALEGRVAAIGGMIPAQASAQNPLADKAFVNSSVQTATANFRGNYDCLDAIPVAENAYLADYAGGKRPSVNDYLVVRDMEMLPDEWAEGEAYGVGDIVNMPIYDSIYYCIAPVSNSIDPSEDPAHWKCWLNYFDQDGYQMSGTWRFKYTGNWDTNGVTGWQPEYQVNESPMTAAQLAAINSNITAKKVAKLDALPDSMDRSLPFANPVGPWCPDPCFWKGDDGYYYVKGTGRLVTVKRTRDFTSFQDTGRTFISESAMQWLADTYGHTSTDSSHTLLHPHQWAPFVIKIGQRWVMYLAVVERSGHKDNPENGAAHIVALTCRTPYGDFSNPVTIVSDGDLHAPGSPSTLWNNVIDPFVYCDPEDGKLYLLAGSSYAIRRCQLSDDGLSVAEGATAQHVAGQSINTNPSRTTVFEGAYLYSRVHDGTTYWYLFVSSGDYANRNYCVKVGRSIKASGIASGTAVNFQSKDGRSMRNGAAETLLTTESDNSQFWGPGHIGGILEGSDGRTFMLYHCHDGNGNADRKIFIQEIFWNEYGWPYFGNDGHPVSGGTISERLITGTTEITVPEVTIDEIIQIFSQQ